MTAFATHAAQPLVEGPQLTARAGGGFYLFYDRFDSGYVQSEFQAYRTQFTTLAGLLDGTDPLTDETACVADRRTVRHGSAAAL